MSRSFSVTEPHPTIPKKGAYLAGGRGGAGNYKKYSATELTTGPSASGPASRVTLARPERRLVAAGRGGAGNMFNEAEHSIFQFDEEMLTRREKQAPVYHIGRGGAANWVDEGKPKTSRMGSTSSTSSQTSNDTTHSATSGGVRRSAERAIHGMFGRRSS